MSDGQAARAGENLELFWGGLSEAPGKVGGTAEGWRSLRGRSGKGEMGAWKWAGMEWRIMGGRLV